MIDQATKERFMRWRIALAREGTARRPSTCPSCYDEARASYDAGLTKIDRTRY